MDIVHFIYASVFVQADLWLVCLVLCWIIFIFEHLQAGKGNLCMHAAKSV